MHPEPLAARHELAREERRVSLEPAEDGMAWLNLLLEAERGVAIMAHLDAVIDARMEVTADSVHDCGTAADHGAGVDAALLHRNARAQARADVAADLLLGREALAGAGGSSLGVVTPKVYVTVPVLTFLRHTDESAELDGYGPIDAETARELAAHARSWQHILTHPETGAYLSYGRACYRVPADLAGYLRVRDGVCRFPGCSRRAAGCDLDHTRDWAAGGATRHDNLAAVCRKHHRLKHHTGWRMSQMPGGDIRWTSPAGREHATSPDQPFEPVLPIEPPWAAKRPDAVA